MSFRQRNDRKEENYEYYEDTHNEKGEYIGSRPDFSRKGDMNVTAPKKSTMKSSSNVSMSMGSNSRILVYYPKTPEDVMVLIEHLRMNDPAIVNLDSVDEATAQRILDFLSGAVCALLGTTHRISGNLFLLSPKGVEITIPYEQK